MISGLSVVVSWQVVQSPLKFLTFKSMALLPSWLQGSPRCPANPEEKGLVEHGFQVIGAHLGAELLRNATVVEPTPTFFPDPWDGTPTAALALFARVCRFMQVEPDSVHVSFWRKEEESPEVKLPGIISGQTESRGAAGTYSRVDGVDEIRLNAADLKDPEGLIATIAHELAHVLLLSRSGMSRDEPHMEALTDLATIYLGFGIFTSNTLLRSKNWTDGNVQGWRVQRKGYISPEMAGWALSLFAWQRQELNPKWARHLATDGKAYLKMGLRYLQRTA